MTNADKYLKENVDIHTLSKEIISFMNGAVEDKYIGMIEDFFNCPVKPILTEDEKVILKYVNQERYAQIGRTKNGEIIFKNVNDSYCVLTPYFNFENIFQFIQPRRRI